MDKRWLISYRIISKDFISKRVKAEGFGNCISDVSPAEWLLHASLKVQGDIYILYTEEISISLATELIHCGIGIRADYFKEVDLDDTTDIF